MRLFIILTIAAIGVAQEPERPPCVPYNGRCDLTYRKLIWWPLPSAHFACQPIVKLEQCKPDMVFEMSGPQSCKGQKAKE